MEIGGHGSGRVGKNGQDGGQSGIHRCFVERSTSLAVAGTAANGETFTTMVLAGPIAFPSHWNSGPDRVDGFATLVSQMRMAGPTEVNTLPLPPADEEYAQPSASPAGVEHWPSIWAVTGLNDIARSVQVRKISVAEQTRLGCAG